YRAFLMSLSEPCSPNKSCDLIDDKWLAVSSCVELSDQKVDERTDALVIARLSSAVRKKRAIEIFLAENEGTLDDHVENLRTFARSTGGLIDDDIRRIVWPVLARHLYKYEHEGSGEQEIDELTDEDLNTHKEWNQVQLDVHRTLARFPPNIEKDERDDLQNQLTPLIVKLISARRDFNYYQGLHDVFLTLLLVVGQDSAEDIGRHLIREGVFHDYLAMSLDQGVCKQLELIYVILSRVDPAIEAIFREVQLGPIFALSWPLTWFSHSLHSYNQIVRVFDSFVASDPLLPIYFSAACILYRRSEIMTTEREMPFLHKLLGTLPKNLPIDSLVSDALYLAKLIPPLLLKGKYLTAYRETAPPTSNIAPVVSSISRYAIQAVFVAGAMSAAAVTYFLSRS
ncbi:hypothetical protein PFISCL1PPCAC_6060, partial [Pristionchus fissidentatus]